MGGGVPETAAVDLSGVDGGAVDNIFEYRIEDSNCTYLGSPYGRKVRSTDLDIDVDVNFHGQWLLEGPNKSNVVVFMSRRNKQNKEK